MGNKYYKLSSFRRVDTNSRSRWETIYFEVDAGGNLNLVSRDDDIEITNSKLEKLSKKEAEDILRDANTLRDTTYG